MFFKSTKEAKVVIDALNKIIQGEIDQKVPFYSQKNLKLPSSLINEAINRLRENIYALRKDNAQLQAVLSSMIEGVIVVDSDTKIISINPAVEKIFSISKIDSEGKLFLERIRNNDLAEIASKVLNTGKFITREIELVWPIEKIFQVNASPLFEVKRVSGCLIVFHDITEIRKLETIRKDFVANVSHELKTPLTSINGFVETLLEGALDDKENSRHFLEIIKNHAERLNSLINDLLDLSKIESRQIKLQFSEINLHKLYSEVTSGFKSQLKKKSIDVKNEIPESLVVSADKAKLQQVLVNLIDNAIKFNKEAGLIKVSSETNGRKIKVAIEDSGFGIPAKDLSRIFERFYRVDKARSRELSGTGLGLSIVKHIVELHGGSVGVESIEGLGSKFWFTILK